MKVTITRTDVVHVVPARGAPLEHASAARQLVGFCAAFTKTIFDDTTGLALETSDGEWEYEYVDHVRCEVGFVPPPPPDPEPEES